jgi:hypothetical protein
MTPAWEGVSHPDLHSKEERVVETESFVVEGMTKSFYTAVPEIVGRVISLSYGEADRRAKGLTSRTGVPWRVVKIEVWVKGDGL